MVRAEGIPEGVELLLVFCELRVEGLLVLGLLVGELCVSVLKKLFTDAAFHLCFEGG